MSHEVAIGQTLRVKRARKRYKEIAATVRQKVEFRQAQEREIRRNAVVTATTMALIKNHLNVELTDEERAYLDEKLLAQYSEDTKQEWLDLALKYLSPDFTPDKLYRIWERNYHPDTLYDWLCVRWAIVRVVEDRLSWGSIPSNYYGFESNDDFFFDTDLVINPKGQNHTSWKLTDKGQAALVQSTQAPPPPVQEKMKPRDPWWKCALYLCNCTDHK
jgi:hypothetical protein